MYTDACMMGSDTCRLMSFDPIRLKLTYTRVLVCLMHIAFDVCIAQAPCSMHDLHLPYPLTKRSGCSLTHRIRSLSQKFCRVVRGTRFWVVEPNSIHSLAGDSDADADAAVEVEVEAVLDEGLGVDGATFLIVATVVAFLLAPLDVAGLDGTADVAGLATAFDCNVDAGVGVIEAVLAFVTAGLTPLLMVVVAIDVTVFPVRSFCKSAAASGDTYFFGAVVAVVVPVSLLMTDVMGALVAGFGVLLVVACSVGWSDMGRFSDVSVARRV